MSAMKFTKMHGLGNDYVCVDLFAERVCDAVMLGEETGTLDEQAFRIADALEAGDLSSIGLDKLEEQPASLGPSPIGTPASGAMASF